MSDKLKEHIESNRENFEIYDLDIDQSWNDLSSKIRPMNSSKTVTIEVRWLYRSIAAIAIFAMIFTFYRNNMEENRLPSEYWEAQSYYQGEIDSKLTQVMQRIDNPEIIADLEDLDNALEELKKDLRDDVQNEEVIYAMIENYQLKLMILEEILEELEGKNDEEVIGI